MKTAVLIACMIIPVALGLHLATPSSAPQGGKPAAFVTQGRKPPATVTHFDPRDVFQRAFWRRPTADDRIVHAERREWTDSGEVTKWQWFVEVKPSTELRKYLFDDNSFRLRAAAAAPKCEDAPNWFVMPSDPVVTLRSAGRFSLTYCAATNTLYATDSGDGFAAGAPEAQNRVASSSSQTVGRLPTTTPPQP